MNWNLLPPWITEPPPAEDEVIKAGWKNHALQMANQFYSPSQLAYRRMQVGEDSRIKYIAYFLDVRGQRVLELGPQEGHHSILLEKMGVSELISLEAREPNLLKCRRIKEKYQLTRTTYLQHDIERLYSGLETPLFSGGFDLVFCVGVFYHLSNPARALEWFRSLSPTLFLGTLHIEQQSLESYFALKPAALDYKGKRYGGMVYEEGGMSDERSGTVPISFWPNEPSLMQMLRDAGYSNISLLGKDLQNRLPHITILAKA